MRTSLLALSGITLAASLAVATPALADIPNDYSTTFSAEGQTADITFNGLSDGSVLSGLSGDLVLTLTDITDNTWTFDFDLTNTSDSTIWDAARITGFGFDVDPNIVSATLDSTVFGYIGSGNYPDNGLADHSVEICFTNNQNGNCAGSSGGVALGDTGTGMFTLTFDQAVTSVVLSGFIDRYQGLESDQLGIRDGSATGIPVGGKRRHAVARLLLSPTGAMAIEILAAD